MSEWINKKCTDCKGDLFIKSDWSTPPENCEYCRAKKVQHIVRKLENYLRNREKYDNKPMPASDRIIMQVDKDLRTSIKEILSEKELDNSHLVSKLLEYGPIRKLILRLDKESKINDKARKQYVQKNGKTSITKNIRLVRGGSPGLGKNA